MALSKQSNMLRKEELINQIIDVAYNIIDNHGYDHLSTRKIAQEVGYTVGNLYNLFPGIDYIIIGVNQKILKNILIELKNAINNQDSYSMISGVPTNVTAIAMAYYNFSQQKFNLWNTVFERNISANIKIPEAYKEETKKVYYFVGQILAQYEHDSAKLQIRTALFWSGMHGIVSLITHKKFARIGIESVDELIIAFLQNFFHESR